jgi:quercetin dioxygenase-like cupin family protein
MRLANLTLKVAMSRGRRWYLEQGFGGAVSLRPAAVLDGRSMTRDDLVRTDTVRVACIELAVGEESPWHRHTQVHETIFCLRGEIGVRRAPPLNVETLLPGQRCDIGPGLPHALHNPGRDTACYLLIQSGRYDFIAVDPSAARTGIDPPARASS